MSAVEALKYAREGANARTVARRAGVPTATAAVLVARTARQRAADLERRAARLESHLRELVGLYDAHANRLGGLARQVVAVKNSAGKLLLEIDAQLQRLCEANNKAEAALRGEPKRKPVS